MQILTRALKERHRCAGLYLEEDDHFVKLMRGQRVLAWFSAEGATLENILRVADCHLPKSRVGMYS